MKSFLRGRILCFVFFLMGTSDTSDVHIGNSQTNVRIQSGLVQVAFITH